MKLRGVLDSIRSGYKSLAVVAFDFFVVFLAANLIAYPFFRPARTLSDIAVESERAAWLEMNGIETFRRVYPGRSDADLNALLRSTPTLGQLFAPYIQVKSEPMITRGIAIHEDGFRLIGREQGPWPTAKQALNVFVFGGSSAQGAGVYDHEAIAAVLQRQLRERYKTPEINVYNFATGSHYSTQERIFFEQLLMHGIVPDVAIFIDGQNDFYFWNDVPVHTGLLQNAFLLLNPTSWRDSIRLVVERLPLTHAVRHLKAALGGKQMPTASLIGPAHADAEPYSDRSQIDPVIERYFRFKAMVEAVAQRFGTTAIFVWQPAPLYGYDPKLQVAQVAGDHNRHRFGYRAMREAVDRRDPGRNFLWCADVFESATHPMYMDSMHYTAEASVAVSRCIEEAIAARQLIAAPMTRLGASHVTDASPNSASE